MRRQTGTHAPDFEAKVAVATIQGDRSMAEPVKKSDANTEQIAKWNKQLLNSMPGDASSPGLRETRDFRAMLQISVS
jgi:hypothetical protein